MSTGKETRYQRLIDVNAQVMNTRNTRNVGPILAKSAVCLCGENY